MRNILNEPFIDRLSYISFLSIMVQTIFYNMKNKYRIEAFIVNFKPTIIDADMPNFTQSIYNDNSKIFSRSIFNSCDRIGIHLNVIYC